MKLYEIERLSPWQRRRFLKALGVALGASVDPAFRFACQELAGGAAHAQTAAEPPVYFIELNLRDQWDQGHVFVAPGLATHTNLVRGSTGRAAALYYTAAELTKHVVNGTDVYLTGDSKDLLPHLDSVAMIDTCELSKGAIHGHEAANALRSPGRAYESSAGLSMFEIDKGSNHPQGNEAFYSRTPTPASLHNYFLKQREPGIHNGVAFKGISRSLHTVYHFAAGLPGGELDRKFSVEQLLAAFPNRIEDANILANPQLADAFTRLVKRVDGRYLGRRRYEDGARTSHEATLTETSRMLYVGEPRIISLPLTTEERAYWSPGVPNQVGGAPKLQIWEQLAYAFKIVANDMARTVALEFDYVDVHDTRPESNVRTMAKQFAIPMARLIAKLKEAGIYDRTLIAAYTTDGSRAPAANSSGNEGKNTLVLAGGMVRGGYYGDVRVASDLTGGHVYSYHSPDPVTGAPGPGRTDNEGRVSGARVWRTVAKALKIPDALASSFPDVQGAAPLPYVLR